MDYKLAKQLKDEANYHTTHQYLVRNHGNPKICSMCWLKGHEEADGRWSIHWAKKHGREYTHDIDDYAPLCRKCHSKYDWTDKKQEHMSTMAKSQKGSKSESKSLIAKDRPRLNGRFIKATA